MLIDHFDVLRDIVSGAVIVRLRTTGGSSNDGLRLGNMDERDFAAGFGKVEAFTHKFDKIAANPGAATTGEIESIPLEALTPNPRANFKGNFIAHLNRADRPNAVDLEVDEPSRRT